MEHMSLVFSIKEESILRGKLQSGSDESEDPERGRAAAGFRSQMWPRDTFPTLGKANS